MTTATYTVKGMTCGHCVASVKEEVGEIPGVQVDLGTGLMTVESDTPLDAAQIRNAVVEAGYEVADPS